jgi:uncharacterized membrane protein
MLLSRSDRSLGVFAMTLDDLKRLFTGRTLFRLDTVLAVKLMPIVYATGLFALLLWAVRHLFASFSTGIGDGLWGLLELLVFGLLMMLALRIVCEALLVYFRAHASAAEPLRGTRASATLLDEVREAIRDLAEAEDELDYAEADEYIMPATDPAPHPAATTPVPPAAPVTPVPPVPPVTPAAPPPPLADETVPKPRRRTAKRTPPTIEEP